MINCGDFYSKNSYFAAANGYDGFISYFESVFDAKDYTRLFILKGGPGTGKSSIMKRIYSEFEKIGCYCEAIYCSSDVKSLDGVIVERGKRRIAVIDGTAPHRTDTVLPGAYDTLINLGDAWCENILAKEKECIKSFNKLKSKAYYDAYDKLALSSIFARKITAEISNIYNCKLSAPFRDKLCRALSENGNAQTQVRLISAFSKDGLTHLDTLQKTSDTVYSVCGIYGSGEIFIKELAETLKSTGTDMCLFPTPLDRLSYEAIYIKSKKTAVILTDNDNADINTVAFLDKDRLSEIENDIISYEATKDLYLDKAKRSFSSASEYHFALEKIYTPAMDFKKLDEIASKLLEKCKNLLFEDV